MALIFVRHTPPEVAPGLCYGRTDLALAAGFPQEAAAIRAALPPASALFTSPLRRCVQLAELIGEYQVRDAFTEMDFGRWEMVPWDAVPRAELDAWAGDFFHARPHGGESVAQLRARVAAGVAAVPDGAVIVTHAGVIKAAAALCHHPEAWEIKPAFGEIVTLDRP